MHIKVEVSSVTSTETIAGVQQPIIGQKVNEADLRMQDGEASLLGGLTSDQDTVAIAGIPGLANMPVLGYLFGTRSKDREKDDIVIALIPHIIRAPAINSNDQGILAGTEQVVRVDRGSPDQTSAPNGQFPVSQPAAPAPLVEQTPPPSTPPAQLPPLGRVLDLPLGVTQGQNTASDSWLADGSNPLIPPLVVQQPTQQQPISGRRREGGSVELYVTSTANNSAGPQPASDPVPGEPPARQQ
jgi:hypothetical protein